MKTDVSILAAGIFKYSSAVHRAKKCALGIEWDSYPNLPYDDIKNLHPMRPKSRKPEWPENTGTYYDIKYQ